MGTVLGHGEQPQSSEPVKQEGQFWHLAALQEQ